MLKTPEYESYRITNTRFTSILTASALLATSLLPAPMAAFDECHGDPICEAEFRLFLFEDQAGGTDDELFAALEVLNSKQPQSLPYIEQINILNNDEDPQPVGLLLPAVQKVR